MPERIRDIIIVGSGVAGLQAAIHSARRKRDVLVLGRSTRSAAYGTHVENVCGFPPGAGREIVERGVEQAKAFGAELVPEDAVRIEPGGDSFAVTLESGSRAPARALVLAMGVRRERLGVPGEKELVGRGVSYCVDCDANFFKGQPVAVFGNGSAAAAGALTMLEYASDVHLVSEGLEVSEKLRRELDSSAVVSHVPDRILRIVGDERLEAVELEKGGRLELKGLFVELGARGPLQLTVDLGVELDAESFKYVVTDRRQRTNVPGVFAAGDVTGAPFQIAKALGEGCVAGLEAAEFLREGGARSSQA